MRIATLFRHLSTSVPIQPDPARTRCREVDVTAVPVTGNAGSVEVTGASDG
jgi:hypothetical protein